MASTQHEDTQSKETAEVHPIFHIEKESQKTEVESDHKDDLINRALFQGSKKREKTLEYNFVLGKRGRRPKARVSEELPRKNVRLEQGEPSSSQLFKSQSTTTRPNMTPPMQRSMLTPCTFTPKVIYTMPA